MNKIGLNRKNRKVKSPSTQNDVCSFMAGFKTTQYEILYMYSLINSETEGKSCFSLPLMFRIFVCSEKRNV